MTERIEKLAIAMGFTHSPERTIATVMAFYDSLQQDIKQVDASILLPCKEGCDACCHESVFLSAPEFLAVCNYLFEHREQAYREQLLREMIALAEEFADEIEFLESAPAGFERDEVAARIKFRCPMLSENGSCSIYPVRELNGRTFGKSWDSMNDEAYGCTLTRESLRIVDAPNTKLPDARGVRSSFNELVEQNDFVHVYPWWFAKYRAFITG
ncbi:MAG: YkgJ family cysteine cluster protein [Myxococcota bacterium]|nr:YkgJ family cysteine cluster protein [Myxococcota bacterium]